MICLERGCLGISHIPAPCRREGGCHENAGVEQAPVIWLRRATLALLVIAVSAADAQQARRHYRVGVLNEAWTANHPAVEGLKDGMRELGLIEGRDVAYEIRFTRGEPGATDAAAAGLVRAGVDLIFTSNEAATLAAKKATTRIPVVFTLVGDPVLIGAVQTLPYPGGNLTGISSRAPELAPKRLEFLKTLAPKLRRVWFVYYAGEVTDSATVSRLLVAAPRLGVELLAWPVKEAAELTGVLKKLKPGDGLLAPASDTLEIPAAIFEVARTSKVPSAFAAAIWVGHGALVSYGPNFRAQGVQAARLVARILRGARPQDLPVEGADDIDLAVDLKVARQLGLSVPPKLLFRANLVQR
jgi:putative tryptophan/tyrosine transport system substrate-binding protein